MSLLVHRKTHHNQPNTVTTRETSSDPIRLQQYLSPQHLRVAACSYFLSTFSSLPVIKLCLRHLISTGPSVIFQAKVLLNGKPQLTQQLNSNVWHGFLMQHIWVWRYRVKKYTGKYLRIYRVCVADVLLRIYIHHHDHAFSSIY